MTPNQLENYRVVELAKLQQVHGPALEARLQAYDDMIEAIEQEHSGVTDFLHSRGIGRTATIVNLLISHAAIYRARQGR